MRKIEYGGKIIEKEKEMRDGKKEGKGKGGWLKKSGRESIKREW